MSQVKNNNHASICGIQLERCDKPRHAYERHRRPPYERERARDGNTKGGKRVSLHRERTRETNTSRERERARARERAREKERQRVCAWCVIVESVLCRKCSQHLLQRTLSTINSCALNLCTNLPCQFQGGIAKLQYPCVVLAQGRGVVYSEP
jgi:hypothetical protein